MILHPTQTKLQTIFLQSKKDSNKLYALRQLLSTYVETLPSEILFQAIPWIWKNTEAPTFRWRIEWEIKSRKTEDTLLRLLELLKDKNPYYWYFSAEMLIQFPDFRIVVPLLKILEDHNTDRIIKRPAVLALLNITPDELAKIPLSTITDKQLRAIIENFPQYIEARELEFRHH